MKIRKITYQKTEEHLGCNPCSEIILRDSEFCNLAELVVRNEDTLEDLLRKVRIATAIGTVQSTLTNFQFLSDDWKNNCEEERLLGVSLTGVMDHPVLNNVNDTAKLWLNALRNEARKINEELAPTLGINVSAAITCVKPSGTVSQLVGCASGIHPRHSLHYIRNVRMDVKDPICDYLIKKGVMHSPDANYPNQVVFSFPQAAPNGAKTRHDISAVEHLEIWKMYQEEWCEHKPSITVNVKDEEWPEVGAWVWKHFDDVSGVAFLPSFGHSYKQAPYEDCSEQHYLLTKDLTPASIEWSGLVEHDDQTKGSQELACSSGFCDITSL